MTSVSDDGPDAGQLGGAAWLLTLGAVGVFLRLRTYGAGDSRPQTEFFVWLGLLVLLSTFAAAAAVLAGVKNAETRTATRLRNAFEQLESRSEHR